MGDIIRKEQISARFVPLTTPGHKDKTARKQQTPASQQPDTPSPKKHRLFQGLQHPFQKRVPVMLQMTAVECGAACLAMLLSYYGRKTSISEIRERYGVGRDGLSALNIVQAARAFGMRVRSLSLQKSDLRFVTVPAIIHWDFNHFMVLEHWTPEYVDVVDPAQGRRRLTTTAFNDGFTGVVVMMEPGEQFQRGGSPSRISLSSYARVYLRGAPITMLQIIGASLILQFFGLALPILTKVVIDQIIPSGSTTLLFSLGIGMLLLIAADLVVSLLRAMLLIYLQNRIDMRIMPAFFEHMLTLPLSFFQQRSSGDIIARMNSNTVIRNIISSQFISTLLDGSLVVVYLIILMSTAPSFGLLTLGIGILQILLLLSTNRTVRRLAKRELESMGKAQGYETEVLTGITTIKAMGAEQFVFQRWANLFSEQLNASLNRNYLSSVVGTLMSTLRALAPVLLLWAGTLQVLNGQMQLGTMLALNTLANTFLVPLSSLVYTGIQLQVVGSHLDRISDVMDADSEQDTANVKEPARLKGDIRCEHVHFRYDANSPAVLQDISITIERGQKIAIVGQTGSGKSTLGKLLLGLYEPDQGKIYFDDIELRNLNYQSLRSQCGVVMQESNIFSGSIRQNISLTAPDISLDRVITAARLAALEEDIGLMPMGYETFVAEGGNALSGGQRQRLALARALAHAPAILLLDEATSSLDVVTERKVEQNLSRLPCTQIIIAHRLSTVRNADKILVLDHGKLVEAGSHRELLELDGYYSYLIHNQLFREH